MDRSRDEEAFLAIYTAYLGRVFAYIALSVPPAVAEDLTQEVFARVLHGLAAFRGGVAEFEPWLFTIARNVLGDHMRREGLVEDVCDTHEVRARRDAEPAPEEFALGLSSLGDTDLLMLIRRMRPAERQVIFLRFVVDMATAQIGEVLGRSPEDVRQIQSRGLAFLRERLAALAHRRGRRQAAAMWVPMPKAPVLRARRFALAGPALTGRHSRSSIWP